MPRIFGINIPENKRIVISLAYVRGIGDTRSAQILKEVGIDWQRRAKDLTEEELGKLRQAIERKGWALEGDLQRIVLGNIKRMKEIGSWRGLRHARRLPVRGQRTKTNSRTVRGNVRKTATSGKKLTGQKT